MMSFINIKFGNNNNNKIKRIYNNGDIILVRPQNISFPYKILSIKEKKYKFDDKIKMVKIPNQKKQFTLKDICSISNFPNNQNILKLKQNNSDMEIKKRNQEKEINNNNNLETKFLERDYIDKFFSDKRNERYKYFDKKNLTYDKNKENSKLYYFDTSIIKNERNKNSFRFKYDQLTSKVILSDTNEKNLILNRNFSIKKNRIKVMKINESKKNIKRQKSSKNTKIKSYDKIVYKLKRPFSSDNKRKILNNNFEIRVCARCVNKLNKMEENKYMIEKEKKMKKYKKKLKIKKALRSTEFENGYINYINELKDLKIHNNFSKLNKNKGIKSTKNSDIFNYIIIPKKSDKSESNKQNEYYNDFTEFKSLLK